MTQKFITILATVAVVLVMMAVAVGFIVVGANQAATTGKVNNSETSAVPEKQVEDATPKQEAPKAISQVKTKEEIQCEAKAKEALAIFSKMSTGDSSFFGPNASFSYDYTYHYKKSVRRCFISIHAIVSTPNPKSEYHSYYFTDGNLSPAIGSVWYIEANGEVFLGQCLIENMMCTSLEEYKRLTAPYFKD